MTGSVSHTDLTLALALVGVALLLLPGALLGAVARRTGRPAGLGEIVAGIALGAGVLGLRPAPPGSEPCPPVVTPRPAVVPSDDHAIL